MGEGPRCTGWGLAATAASRKKKRKKKKSRGRLGVKKEKGRVYSCFKRDTYH